MEETNKTTQRLEKEIITLNINISSQENEIGQLNIHISSQENEIDQLKRKENALRQSEESFRNLTEEITDGVAVTIQGRNHWVNKAFCEIFGYSKKEIIGKGVDFVVLPEEVPALVENMRKRLAGEEAPSNYETVGKRKDGSIIYIDVSAKVITFENKRAIQIMVKDITERKKTDEALKESEEHYRTMIENANDMIWTLDTQGNFTAFNRQVEMVSGHKFEDWKGKSFAPLIHPDDLEMVSEVFQKTLSGERQQYIVRVYNKNDEMVILSVNTAPFNKKGKVVGTVSFGRDITEQERAVKALKESEEKFRSFAEQSPNMIFINKDGKVKYANQRCVEKMGFTKDEFYSPDFNFWFIISPESHGLIKESLEKHARGEEVDPFEYRLVTKDGTVLDAINNARVIEYEGGPAILGIVTDVTGIKLTERKLKHSEEKFRTLAERSPNMIYINKTGRIMYVNERCVEVMGYTREEFYSADFNFLFLIAPEFHEIVENIYEKLRRGEDVEPYEYQIITKDGKKLNAINNARMIEYEGGPAILGIVTDITTIKLTEEKLKRTQDRCQKIFDSTREGILVSNPQGIIISANPGAAAMLGYDDPDKLIGIAEERLFLEHEKWASLSNDLKKEENLQDIELQLVKKDGDIIHVLSTASTHTDESLDVVNQQIIFMDITERKQAEEEMKRRLMKFRLEEGNLYLIKESTPTLSLEAFKDLQKVGYRGIVLSRSLKEELAKDIDEDFEYYWLAEKDTKFSVKPTISEIRKKFEGLSRRHVVFLDRLDYIIFKNGFKETLSMVQYLRELIYLKGAIVILSLDPFTIKRENLRLLEKECRGVEPQHTKMISDNLFNIMKFIYRQNTLGIKPSYSAVGREVTISKPTVRKRIGYLIATGYLREEIRGRNKTIELTERGRQLFWK